MRSLIFEDVWGDWGNLRDAWYRTFQRQNSLLAAGQDAVLAREKLQLTEDDDNFFVTGEFPGLTPDGVKVSILENVITIKVSQETLEGEHDQPQITRSVKETRRYLLDNVKSSQVAVKLVDGKLTVTMPKIDEIRRKTLPVSTE